MIKVDPARIAGVVETAADDETGAFAEATPVTEKIGEHVAEFLAGEIACGQVPACFLPIQSGVGDIANAVLGALGKHPQIPAFEMYTEVIQDSVIRLMKEERVKFASSCALTVSHAVLRSVYGNLAWFRPRILRRPQEISNNPEVMRRLGVISINTAIEVDIRRVDDPTSS